MRSIIVLIEMEIMPAIKYNKYEISNVIVSDNGSIYIVIYFYNSLNKWCGETRIYQFTNNHLKEI